jgi:hypothetical protein
MSRHALNAVVVATLVAFSATALWTGSSAQAAPAPTEQELAQRYHKEGLALASKKDFARAVDKFQLALKSFPHPATKHSLARAYEELGDLKNAYEWFRRALQEDYTYAAEGRERLAAVETQLRTTHARLTVRTTPSRVTVTLATADGQEELFHSTPFEAWVLGGKTRVTGSNPEFKPGQRAIDLVAGEDRTLNLELEPLPKQGFLQVNADAPAAKVFLSDVYIGDTPLTSMAHPVGVYELRVAAEGFDDHRESVVIDQDQLSSVTIEMSRIGGKLPPTSGLTRTESTGVPTWVGATIIGVGAAAVVAGVVFHVEAFRQANEANSIPISDPINNADEAKSDRLFADAESSQSNAAIAYGVAGGLIVTGALLLILVPEEEVEVPIDGAMAPRFTPSIVTTPTYVGVGGTFTF